MKTKAVGIGLLSFGAGFLAWLTFYIGLGQAINSREPLANQEEIAFKAVYLAISVISATLALGVGWWGAKRAGASRTLAICVIFTLIVIATIPIGQLSSIANDCGLGIENWPFRVGGCD